MIALVLLVAAAVASLASADEGALRRHLDAEVTRHERALSDARVQVSVDDDRVLLRGTVRFYRQKMLYEQIAWQTPGVREVENEVQVVPLVPATDAEIERKVVELAKLARFQGVGLQVTVRDGRVATSGTFHEPADVFFLKHRVAEIEGVRDIAIAASFAV